MNHAVSTLELHAALEQELNRRRDIQCHIDRLERRPSAYYSSFALEELDAHLDDGATLRLVFKDLSRQGLLEDARAVKPAFLHDPLREIGTYQSILTSVRLGTAECYGAVVAPQAGRYWLFLERVEGAELSRVSEFSAWQQAARWLAVLHARFAGATRPLRQTVPLLCYDGEYYRLWLRRARAFLSQRARSQLEQAQRDLDRLAERYDPVVERLLAMPVTLIHGEFYASNVLIQQTVEGPRVCPVDWEMAAVGPGLMDLADLTAGKWTPEQKTSLALAYHETLAGMGGCLLPIEGLLGALDCCRLHRAVQWLGWSPQWMPPPEHAQDWLREALGLAEKLGL